jgi:methionine biosynthesis protein MetW
MIKSDSYYETYWSGAGFCPHGYMKPELERLFRKYLDSGMNCLDVGCGDGGTSGKWLVQHGYGYLGVDVSENAVDSAIAAGLDAKQIEDAAHLPFGDESFDAAVCIEVLEHLFEPQKAAMEMLRVLRPGGCILVTVPNVAYWRRRLEMFFLGRWNPLGDYDAVLQPWRDPHIRFFTASALRRMLISVGFSRVHIGGHSGALLRDIPGIGRYRSWNSGNCIYRAAETVFPGLLGYALHGVAYK